MSTHNAANERIKRQYFAYLAEALGHSEQTIDAVAKALTRFEAYTRHREFKAFHIDQAKGFKRMLSAEQRAENSDERLSRATQYATVTALKRFFVWLAGQPGYKSRISYADAEYFNLSIKEARIAKASRPERVPTLDQIRHVLQCMPTGTDIELRDRALVAFTILTGARDGAIASLKLRHLEMTAGRLDQDARDVQTKFAKSFATWFFPVGDDIREIVGHWVRFLHAEKLYGPADPLFPATAIGPGETFAFKFLGLPAPTGAMPDQSGKSSKRHSVAPISRISTPIVFCRKTLAGLAGTLCRTPEDYKAWSQNLGHDSVLTTFSSYGNVNGSGKWRSSGH